jgi:hypothetical protein
MDETYDGVIPDCNVVPVVPRLLALRGRSAPVHLPTEPVSERSVEVGWKSEEGHILGHHDQVSDLQGSAVENEKSETIMMARLGLRVKLDGWEVEGRGCQNPPPMRWMIDMVRGTLDRAHRYDERLVSS